jgi:hypothetical protein
MSSHPNTTSLSSRKDSGGSSSLKKSGADRKKHFSVFCDGVGSLFELEEDDTKTDQQQLSVLRRTIARHFKKGNNFVLTLHNGSLVTSRQHIKEGQTYQFTDKLTLPLPV